MAKFSTKKVSSVSKYKNLNNFEKNIKKANLSSLKAVAKNKTKKAKNKIVKSKLKQLYKIN